MFDKPKVLYHGTAAAHVDSILLNGVKPRGRNKKANNPQVSSCHDAVYLSTAFPVFFAVEAMESMKNISKNVAIFEVDARKLDWDFAAPDDDVLAQMISQREGIEYKKAFPKARRIIKEYLGEDTALAGMNLSGSIAYFKAIPFRALTRYAVLDWEKQFPLILGLFDVSTGVMGYKISGETHRRKLEWIFDNVPFVDPRFPEMTPEIEAIIGKAVPDSRDGIQVVDIC